uniref:Uncharacterized protein n=1 Tax=Klebsiella pneumoniae TaxID=573 RepID=A0A7M1I0L9_KLEPN|nr:hypothetical protein PMIDBGBA_05360 [Klebsiella pneumoniae]
MSRSETQITWMAENVLSWETVSGHITQRDLNRYYLLDVYLQAHFQIMCCSPDGLVNIRILPALKNAILLPL